MTPKRIQRRRTKGWRMPEGAVYVGRPTVFGNPYKVGDRNPRNGLPFGHGEAATMFRLLLTESIEYLSGIGVPGHILEWREAIRFQGLPTLRGKDLVCWCPLDKPCHADVLLEIANRQEAVV